MLYLVGQWQLLAIDKFIWVENMISDRLDM